jgi:site-specific DNA-methyltransferase (adenine-specific)
MEGIGMINIVHNMDCNIFMRDKPDKFYDLAIVDPPYGINVNMNCGRRKHEDNFFHKKSWDKKPPDKEYFDELFRVSKNQIIWGANNFSKYLPFSNGWIVWDKEITGEVDFSICELAYTNFLNHIVKYSYRIQGNVKKEGKPIHPNQKPIALYKWLLKNYAKPGQTIFDSHVGSGSIRIACHDMGFDFEGCELDADYWQAQEERYKIRVAQPEIFEKKEIFEQGNLI